MARTSSRIAAGAGAAVAALLANGRLVRGETRPAHVEPGGRLVATPGGEVHVREDGHPANPAMVLLHGFAGSAHWFDRLAPLLARDHRVIRVDLIGHGASAKPAAGYAIDDQADAVDAVLDRLGIGSAVLLGHSFGAAVAVALAGRTTLLVERLVLLDEGPDNGFGDQPLMTRLGFAPIVGELMHRLAFDPLVRDGYRDAFAEDFDLAQGFDDPDQVVRDFRNMTYTSYAESWAAEDAFLAERRLDQRLRELELPATVVFGEHDRFFHAEPSAAAFRALPRTRVELMPGVGHSPNVERPAEVARLALEPVLAAA